MANYLLDTGVVIRHLRDQRPAVKLLRSLGRQGRLSVSVGPHLEGHVGMHPNERYATQKLLSRFVTIGLDGDIADRAGELIRASRGRGEVLSVPDAIIAATAITHHLTLVTYNTDHFKRISGLSLEPITEM